MTGYFRNLLSIDQNINNLAIVGGIRIGNFGLPD